MSSEVSSSHAVDAPSGTDERPQGVAVRVRYFAGARAAAGTAEESVLLPAGSTVHDAVTELQARHGAGLARVLAASSFLVDGVAVRDRAIVLSDGAGLDVLPPFAGG